MPIVQPSFITYTELKEAGVRPTAEFLDPTYASEVSQATMQAVDAGREAAFFVPVVKLATDIALAACTLPTAFERLPAEVSQRARITQSVARLIGERGARSGLFLKAYQADPYLQRGLRQNTGFAQDLQDDIYLSSQCEAPFREVGRVAGGAFHALCRRGVSKGQEDIVARSKSLPLAASIPKEHAREVYGELGVPYVNRRHFSVSKVDGQTTIEFAPKTTDYLRSYVLPHRGCPATTVYPYGGNLGNLLRSGWENTVYYLLLPGAQVTF